MREAKVIARLLATADAHIATADEAAASMGGGNIDFAARLERISEEEAFGQQTAEAAQRRARKDQLAKALAAATALLSAPKNKVHRCKQHCLTTTTPKEKIIPLPFVIPVNTCPAQPTHKLENCVHATGCIKTKHCQNSLTQTGRCHALLDIDHPQTLTQHCIRTTHIDRRITLDIQLRPSLLVALQAHLKRSRNKTMKLRVSSIRTNNIQHKSIICTQPEPAHINIAQISRAIYTTMYSTRAELLLLYPCTCTHLTNTFQSMPHTNELGNRHYPYVHTIKKETVHKIITQPKIRHMLHVQIKPNHVTQRIVMFTLHAHRSALHFKASDFGERKTSRGDDDGSLALIELIESFGC